MKAIYSIFWKTSAKKELKRIDKSDIPKIISAIEELSKDPFPANTKKYSGTNHTYRIRVGDYRVIYSILKDILTIEVIKVGHRKDVYKKFK
ncbi:MAG: type II toxin-antitoxin system RelE family toxin [Thermodesulfobacteriota bacterium]